MRYLSPIDPHVHLRGTEYSTAPAENFTVKAIEDAKAVGLRAILEMPNPVPWLTDIGGCALRKVDIYNLKHAMGADDIYHGINIGMTNDLKLCEETLARIQHADKIFYTHSTGNMGILDPEIQRRIWQIKGKMGYDKVSIGHFEDEKVYTGGFDPRDPASHSRNQNSNAELFQIMTQIGYAVDAGFKGIFYVAHTSNPKSVDFLIEARNKVPFRIVIETTWHHMLLNTQDYKIHGNRVKMNPPLRSEMEQQLILDHVLRGHIDIIGTDHAPHSLEKKDDLQKPASGIPGILFWPAGIEILTRYGMSRARIDDMIFHNANKVFGLGLTPREVNIDYNPILWRKYGFNPFSRYDYAVTCGGSLAL